MNALRQRLIAGLRLLFLRSPAKNIYESRFATFSVYFLLSFVSAVLTIFNVVKNYRLMAFSTAFLIIGFFIAGLLAVNKKDLAASIIIAVLCGFTFSLYALIGGNNGFAILWILLVPIISMFLVGLRLGFWLSLYFQLFLIVIFYTPISRYMAEFYTPTFIMRYPVLYFASFAAITILMCQRQALFNRIHDQAYLDPMTGLNNRLYYNEFKKKEDQHADRRPLYLVSMDLNGLKHANDHFGHAAGDELIIASAKLIRESFPNDLCFRMGGDEFLVISREDISGKIDAFRNSIRSWKGKLIPDMNISVGLASGKEHPELSFSDLEMLADQNMYAEKSAYYRQTGHDRRH